MPKLTIRGTLKRAAALTLAAACAASLCTVPGAEATNSSDRSFTIYEWSLVSTVSNGANSLQDLPQKNIRAIFVWDEGNNAYYTGSGMYHDDTNINYFHSFATMANDPDMDPAFDTFYTPGARGSFYLDYVDEDNDNNGREYYVYFPNSDDTGRGDPMGLEFHGWPSHDFLNFTSSHIVPWSISNSLKETSANHVKVFYNYENHWDDGWQINPDAAPSLTCLRVVNDWNVSPYSQFMMYVGRPISFHQRSSDEPISAGQTAPIADKTIIPAGVTLTVEKGAVLTIKGLLINNGVIKNYGTVLMQKGGSIMTFDEEKNSRLPDGTRNGSLICDGGGLILQTGSTLITRDGEGGLILRNGAACVNAGTIISSNGMDLTDGILDNRANGVVFFGYNYTGSPADFTTTTKHPTLNLPLPKVSGTTADMQGVKLASGQSDPVGIFVGDGNSPIKNAGVIMQNIPTKGAGAQP